MSSAGKHTMVSSYWPQPELSNTNTQRYYSQCPIHPNRTHLNGAISAIAEEPEAAHEGYAPNLTRQPTTSALRAPRSSFNSRSTPTPEQETSFDKERDSNLALSFPHESPPLHQTLLKRHRLALGTCIPILFGISQILMLVYFLDLYLTLPRKSFSRLPRISSQYSIWPYISCMASLNRTAFKIFAFLVAFFLCATFVFELCISLHTRPGYWLRRLLIPVSFVWSALFVWLVFASKDIASHVHLYIVSGKLFASLAIKTMSFFTGHQMRKHYPALKTDRVASISHRWKQAVLLTAFPVAILANIGIYACMDEAEVQTPGTSCYLLTAIAAIADWTYAAVDIAFVLNLAYDIYHHDHLEMSKGVDAKAIGDIERHLSAAEM